MFGDRNWTNIEPMIAIFTWLAKTYPDAIIIHGDANGADKMAGMIAGEIGFEVETYPAHWHHNESCPPDCKRYVGRAAGPIRNQQMIDEGQPTMAFGFHDDIKTSKGAADMFRRLRKHTIENYLITSYYLPPFIN